MRPLGLERSLAAARYGLRTERPGFPPGLLDAAVDTALASVVSLPGAWAATALPARSSIVIKVETHTGAVVVKVPLIAGHRLLEEAGLRSWGIAALTPRLLPSPEMTCLVMTCCPGSPVYAEPPSAVAGWTARVACWYARCHSTGVAPMHSLGTGEVYREWRRWLNDDDPLVVRCADRAVSALDQLSRGRSTVLTHADPNRGNFLHESACGVVRAVDPLPGNLPAEIVVARAALQLRPDNPEAFLGFASAAMHLDRSVVDEALRPLAVFTLDWADTGPVRTLAASFESAKE